MNVFGAIEAGGTKFVCGVGTGPHDLETERIDTTSPDRTIEQVVKYFSRHPELKSIGVGSFGPVDLRRGIITSTPKPGWKNTPLADLIHDQLGVPVGFDTDVNAAALGEHGFGAAQGVSDFLYLTVGTGIGGGALVNGRLLHGLVHPEMGHIRVRRNPRDSYPGICEAHGDCLEGLACGPAIKARYNQPANELPADHEVWEFETDYLAEALATWVCTLSPELIVMGGGVMEQEHLFPRIRTKLLHLLNGYIRAPRITEQIDTYIVPARSDAGVLGALVLAKQAYERSLQQPQENP